MSDNRLCEYAQQRGETDVRRVHAQDERYSRSPPWIGAHLLGAAALLWVAIANGFPLLFSDSGSYLRVGTELHYTSDRPVTYGLLIAPLARVGGLWAVILAQALLTAWVIGLTLVAITGRRSAGLLSLVLLLLAAASSLPWFVGQIMPDLFTGLIPLLIFLILFAPEAAAGWRRWLLPALLAVLVASHLSHVVIASALVLIGALLHRGLRSAPDETARALPAVAATLMALLGMSAMNGIAAHRFRPSVETNAFLLARLFDTRIAQPVLDQKCRVERWKLCAVRDLMDDPHRAQPGQDYLWADGVRAGVSPDDPEGLRREEGALIAATLRSNPGGVIRAAFAGWGEQFFRARAADGMEPRPESMQAVRQVERHYPGEYPAFARSREQRGTIQSLAIVPDRALALLLLLANPVLLYWASRRGEHRLVGLVVLSIATLFINAAVCGALSGPADRYQSRVLWLIPFAAAVSLVRIVRTRRHDAADPKRDGSSP